VTDEPAHAGPVIEAARAALAGRLVIFPTDTVYGLGTRPDDPSATARVFEAKRRTRDLELPVLVSTVEAAREIAGFDDRAERLAREFWPGALTLVLSRADRSEGWDLGGDVSTIGVRVPAHPLARAVVSAAGPLAVTSANVSGEDPITTCGGLRAAFADVVAVMLCEQEPLEGSASTVVDLAHGEARLLRRGDLGVEEIRRSLPEGEALLDSRPSP